MRREFLPTIFNSPSVMSEALTRSRSELFVCCINILIPLKRMYNQYLSLQSTHNQTKTIKNNLLRLILEYLRLYQTFLNRHYQGELQHSLVHLSVRNFHTKFNYNFKTNRWGWKRQNLQYFVPKWHLHPFQFESLKNKLYKVSRFFNISKLQFWIEKGKVYTIYLTTTTTKKNKNNNNKKMKGGDLPAIELQAIRHLTNVAVPSRWKKLNGYWLALVSVYLAEDSIIFNVAHFFTLISTEHGKITKLVMFLQYSEVEEEVRSEPCWRQWRRDTSHFTRERTPLSMSNIREQLVEDLSVYMIWTSNIVPSWFFGSDQMMLGLYNFAC